MVTAMSGGAANKAGNQYEHLWVVLRITEMLEGRVSRIRPEPPGVAGTGIELELDIDGVTWGEQTKDDARNWTINRLIREGVLAAAKIQIDQGRHYRFVASSATDVFGTLAYRARKTESFAEYTESLGENLQTRLAEVAQAWSVSREEASLLLQNVEVEHIPADALKRIVTAALRCLYVDDPGLVAGELRNFCGQRVHETLTAPQVSEHLESKGLRRRLLLDNTNVITGLQKTRERHERRVKGNEPSIGLVPRGDIESVLEMLRDSEGKQIVAVDGRAGSGKSTVVSAVAAVLEQEDWFVAVARMDTDATMRTSSDLGREISLSESPSVLLTGVSDGSPALLVIDQLDAVSMYSGRMPDNFDAVDEVLDEITRAPNVKVLLVVRTIDLEDDPRLRSLIQEGERVGRHTVGDLDIESVKAHIVDHGMQLPASDSTIELLRRPLHLSVFSRLSDSARSLEYTTLQGLYESYTREMRYKVEDRVGHLHWAQITGAMVSYMSHHEALTAPAAVLDEASLLEVEALVSESVIVRDRGAVAFFHESYFDYLFARSFVATDRDLRSFLIDSGQHLFRRAQTRQVLEHLAATDRDRFIAVVVDLLECDDVRFHLRAVVINVLRQIQPTPAEWEALETFAFNGTIIGSKVLTLLGQLGWFDAVDSLDRWESWLDDPERANVVFNQLALSAKQRPSRVAELVRPHVAESEDWSRRLRRMISWALNTELVDLAVELVELGQLDDDRDPDLELRDFWSMIRYSLKDEDPAGAARLIGAFLHRGLVRARSDASEDPFQSGHLSSNSQSASVISDVAAKVPAEFIDHVLPFIIDVAMANQDQLDGFLPAGRRWSHRTSSQNYTVDNIVFAAADDALRILARKDPEKCAAALQTPRLAESDELRFLACRALTVMRDPNGAIGWIISDTRNLTLGWSDSQNWASRELIEECSSGCSSDLFLRLESAILHFRPNWERGSRGYSQYELLSALDTTRMSRAARGRLREMERRFPGSPPQAPESTVAQYVGPPISDDASMYMSDDNWIRALKRHNSDQTTWNGDVPVGGARQLAGLLGRRVRDDPRRFERLALRFSDEIPAVAMNEIIRNVESSADIDAFADLCEHAHDVYGTAAGHTVCSAIARAGVANSRLATLISVYANDADPDHEKARTVQSSGGLSFGGDLVRAGLNSTRGQAALAASSVLFSGPDHVDALLPVVEALSEDDVLAVRVCASEAILALLKHAPEHALDLAERLFDAHLGVLDADTTERLLGHAICRDSERFVHVLAEGLDGPADVATRAGRIWALARLQGWLPSGLVADFRSLPSAARVGAADVIVSNVADCLDDLSEVFDDDDPAVRSQSWHAMQQLDEIAVSDLDPLIDAFMSSAAFPEQMRSLIDALEQLPSALPANSITVCERAVEIASEGMATGSSLIAVVLRLYRQGDAGLRSRCLDIVDQLTEFSVYDLEPALNDER